MTPAEIRKADDKRIKTRIFAIEWAHMVSAASITPALKREHTLLMREFKRRGLRVEE